VRRWGGRGSSRRAPGHSGPPQVETRREAAPPGRECSRRCAPPPERNNGERGEHLNQLKKSGGRAR